MYLGRRNRGLLLIPAILLLLYTNTVSGDIYRYRDENGIWHYTNIKTDERYELFIKTRPSHEDLPRFPYEDIIRRTSERYDLDPFLLLAVIKAESGFRPYAISSKGARGLMQLMPETIEELNIRDPFDPEENIYGGARYLKILLEIFKDELLALAAYNAGIEKVKMYNGIPPYPETRQFILRVLRYYRLFKERGS